MADTLRCSERNCVRHDRPCAINAGAPHPHGHECSTCLDERASAGLAIIDAAVAAAAGPRPSTESLYADPQIIQRTFENGVPSAGAPQTLVADPGALFENRFVRRMLSSSAMLPSGSFGLPPYSAQDAEVSARDLAWREAQAPREAAAHRTLDRVCRFCKTTRVEITGPIVLGTELYPAVDPREFQLGILNPHTGVDEGYHYRLAHVECRDCEAKYTAWIATSRDGVRLDANNPRRPFDMLSFRAELSAEPTMADLPAWEIRYRMLTPDELAALPIRDVLFGAGVLEADAGVMCNVIVRYRRPFDHVAWKPGWQRVYDGRVSNSFEDFRCKLTAPRPNPDDDGHPFEDLDDDYGDEGHD